MGMLLWPDYTPGKAYGPCAEECKHRDCAELRDPEKANPVCCDVDCNERLQAGDMYFFVGVKNEPAHANCVIKREEEERAERARDEARP